MPPHPIKCQMPFHFSFPVQAPAASAAATMHPNPANAARAPARKQISVPGRGADRHHALGLYRARWRILRRLRCRRRVRFFFHFQRNFAFDFL